MELAGFELVDEVDTLPPAVALGLGPRICRYSLRVGARGGAVYKVVLLAGRLRGPAALTWRLALQAGMMLLQQKPQVVRLLFWILIPMVRFADQKDLSFVAQDGYISRDIVARKIDAGEVVIAEQDGSPVGYLRIEYLWSKLPYITLIRVVPDHRREGVGKALLGFLERELERAGHTLLLSSSQADEPEPQAWHRHAGFTECGRLEKLNDGGIDEVFFRKELSPG